MRARIAGLLMMTALLGSAPALALGAESGEVTATVTVAAPCVTVGGPIDFGEVGFAPEGDIATSSGLSNYTNCSSVTEQIAVRGTNASSTTTSTVWTLQSQQPCVGTTTLNEFRVETKDVDQLSLALSTSASTIDPALAAGTPAQTLWTMLYMPCTGSDGAGETMQFTITVIAFF